MSRTWLIDGKAFNSARWRSVIRDSLADMHMFLNDINATMDEDGNITFFGFKRNQDGTIQRDEQISLNNEQNPLYETNRAENVGQTLALDGHDFEILETFKLPVEARFPRFEELYKKATVENCGTSLWDSWHMIPDTAKLVYTLHLWERLLKGKLAHSVWAANFSAAWPHGKVGSLLFRANISESEVVKMFFRAPPDILMDDEEQAIYNSLPNEVTAWRGVSSASKYQQRGFSWTLNKERAEWFALANTVDGSPVVIEGKFKKDAVLMCAQFEEEIVMNPSIPPFAITKTVIDNTNRQIRMGKLRKLLAKRDSKKNW